MLNAGYLKKIRCGIVFLLITSLLLSPVCGYAQGFVSTLPEPGKMVAVSPAFTPVLVKGLVVHPDKPLDFNFIVDSGNEVVDAGVIKEQSERLVKYFLAALTVPEKSLWVNLSPYEKDRIIDDGLGQTILGRDMLAQDYVLKQLTASLIYPEDDLGKAFWSRIYKEAREKFGTTDIPVDTFNKVWIVPAKAEVYEKGNAVYVTQARLKVMLDSDYTAMGQNNAGAVSADALTDDARAAFTKAVIREVVLPAIEQEVNQGKNFAALRQVYYAAILAKWYRELVKDTLMAASYVGQNKVAGVNNDDKTLKEQIYQRYIAAYKQGVFNYIKEEENGLAGETIPRKYFSGGLAEFGDMTLDRAASIPVIDRAGSLYEVKYTVGRPQRPVSVVPRRVPEGWKVASPLGLSRPQALEGRRPRDSAMTDILLDFYKWIGAFAVVVAVSMVVGYMVRRAWQVLTDIFVTVKDTIKQQLVKKIVALIESNPARAVDYITEDLLIESKELRHALEASRDEGLIAKVSAIEISPVRWKGDGTRSTFWGLLRDMGLSDEALVKIKIQRMAALQRRIIGMNDSDVGFEQLKMSYFYETKWLLINFSKDVAGFFYEQKEYLVQQLEEAERKRDYSRYNMFAACLHKIDDQRGDLIYYEHPAVFVTKGFVATIVEEESPSMTAAPGSVSSMTTYAPGIKEEKPATWELTSRQRAAALAVEEQANTSQDTRDASMNGGIDIQNIDVNKTGKARIQFDDAVLRQAFSAGFDGFTPVFINMTPVANPMIILGAANDLPQAPEA